MPPPQHLLAPTIRGFICRSCLSKLQKPRRQPVQWLSSQATSDAGLRRKPEEIRKPTGSEINFFDQTPDGIRTKLDSHNEETEQEVAIAAAMRKEIREIEKTAGKPLEELRGDDLVKITMGGAEGPRVDLGLDHLDTLSSQIDEFNNILQRVGNISDLKNLPASERLRLREEILKLSGDDESLPPLPEQTTPPASTSMFRQMFSQSGQSISVEEESDIIVDRFPEDYQTIIWSLQKALRQIKKSKDKRETRNLWKLYLLARKGLLSTPKMIPKETWLALWRVFEREGTHNLDRMARIKRLGDDMGLAGFHMEPSRRLLYIEALFVEGSQESAIEQWENSVSTLNQNNAEMWRSYWQLGLRMLCEMGELNRALEAAELLLQAAKDSSDYRILLPIIKTCLASKSESSVQRAWAVYIRMRFHMGGEMNMDDYDALISLFMAVNEPDLALGIFKDMMLTGDVSATNEDSIAQYRTTTGLTGNLSPAKIGQQELDWQNSRDLARLPAKFRNKFFFGSWMKKLIGEKNLDAAKQVLDLMQDRQIRPSAIQMNGLIGAWFREGSEKNRELAEEMAWRMIKSRTDIVKARSIAYNLQAPLRAVRSPGLHDSNSIFLTTGATIETFCILIQQYRRRQKYDRMSDLFTALQNAQIPPSTYFMNELLLMDAKTNPNGWAWKTYQSLTKRDHVSPDFQTYSSLWKLMKRTLDPILGPDRDRPPRGLPNCRQLFADMVQNFPFLARKEVLPRDLYELIILSFSYAQDQAGTAVAMRALQQSFNTFPSHETARTVVLQLARLGLLNETGQKPRRLNADKTVTKARIAGVTEILKMITEQRAEGLLKQGVVLDHLQGDARLEETLLTLSDLLRHSAQARFGGEGNFDYDSTLACMEAAGDMGVPDCVPWATHPNIDS